MKHYVCGSVIVDAQARRLLRYSKEYQVESEHNTLVTDGYIDCRRLFLDALTPIPIASGITKVND